MVKRTKIDKNFIDLTKYFSERIARNKIYRSHVIKT